jgi:hypothetical protein
VLSAYNDGRIAADEAKTQLNGLDLSKIDNFGKGYKSTINKINSAVINAEESVKPADGIKIKNYRKSKKKADDVED